MAIVSHEDYDKFGGPAPKNDNGNTKQLIKLGKPVPEYYYKWRLRRRWKRTEYRYSIERTSSWFWWECKPMTLSEFKETILPMNDFYGKYAVEDETGVPHERCCIWFFKEEDAREAIRLFEESTQLTIERGEDKLIYVTPEDN